MSTKTKAGHYGDGSYSLRKDGRYIVRYKGQCRYAHDEAEAIKVLRELRKKVDDGLKPAVHKKLDTYYTEWMKIDRRESGDWKPTTYGTMDSVYRNHIQKVLGSKLLGAIQPKDIQSLLNAKAKEGYSYTIVKHIYVVLKDLYEYAFMQGDVERNPVDRVKRPRRSDFSEQEEVEAFDYDEIDSLEDVAARRNKQGNPLYRHSNLIIFMVETGLRCGEMLGLKWEDIDFDKHEVHIVGNWVTYANPDKGEGETKTISERIDPKTARGNRYIPLSPEAVAAIRQYEKDWGRISEYVAVTSKGKQIDHNELTETLERMARVAGIERHVHLHMLRHTFATIALAVHPVELVSKWLGHKDVTTTYRIYFHVLNSNVAKACEDVCTSG